MVSPPRLFLARGNRYRRIGTELKNTGLVFPVGAMEAAGAAFWRDTIATAVKMGIGGFLHQDLKCEKGIWNHKSYLRCDKKIAPVLFHSRVVQYRGYPVEYFVICCDILSRARLQLTAVIQLERFQKEQVAKAAKVYSGQLRREVNAEREKLGKRPIEDENDNEKDPPQGGGNSGASDLFRI